MGCCSNQPERDQHETEAPPRLRQGTAAQDPNFLFRPAKNAGKWPTAPTAGGWNFSGPPTSAQVADLQAARECHDVDATFTSTSPAATIHSASTHCLGDTRGAATSTATIDAHNQSPRMPARSRTEFPAPQGGVLAASAHARSSPRDEALRLPSNSSRRTKGEAPVLGDPLFLASPRFRAAFGEAALVEFNRFRADYRRFRLGDATGAKGEVTRFANVAILAYEYERRYRGNPAWRHWLLAHDPPCFTAVGTATPLLRASMAPPVAEYVQPMAAPDSVLTWSVHSGTTVQWEPDGDWEYTCAPLGLLCRRQETPRQGPIDLLLSKLRPGIPRKPSYVGTEASTHVSQQGTLTPMREGHSRLGASSPPGLRVPTPHGQTRGRHRGKSAYGGGQATSSGVSAVDLEGTGWHHWQHPSDRIRRRRWRRAVTVSAPRRPAHAPVGRDRRRESPPLRADSSPRSQPGNGRPPGAAARSATPRSATPRHNAPAASSTPQHGASTAVLQWDLLRLRSPLPPPAPAPPAEWGEKGAYVTTARDTHVHATIDRAAGEQPLFHLPEGTAVDIVEPVADRAEMRRLRARIAEPGGWISIENTDNGFRWVRPAAVPCPASPGSEPAPRSREGTPTRPADDTVAFRTRSDQPSPPSPSLVPPEPPPSDFYRMHNLLHPKRRIHGVDSQCRPPASEEEEVARMCAKPWWHRMSPDRSGRSVGSPARQKSGVLMSA